MSLLSHSFSFLEFIPHTATKLIVWKHIVIMLFPLVKTEDYFFICFSEKLAFLSGAGRVLRDWPLPCSKPLVPSFSSSVPCTDHRRQQIISHPLLPLPRISLSSLQISRVRTGFQFPLYTLLALWPCTRYFNTMGLIFLICKLGIIIGSVLSKTKPNKTKNPKIYFIHFIFIY